MSQFFYVHPDNPQQRLMNQAADMLRNGAVICYPTDSGYALGCQLGNKQALDRIIQIRKLDKHHHFTLMCRDLSELSLYSRVENQSYRLIKNNTPGAYTFILKGTREVPRRLLNPKRKTIGIRVPDNTIAQALLAAMGEPIMSTTLILPGAESIESDPEVIRDQLEHQLELVIHGGYLGEQPTTVIDMSEGNVEVIRVGNGDPAPFE